MSIRLVAALFCFSTVPAVAQDGSVWDGPYAGLTYSSGTGFQDYGGSPTYDLEGDGFGLIAGYNYATGPWVIGGELAFSRTDIAELPSGEDYKFTSLLDLKARAGYATGSLLVYGTIGGSFTNWQEGTGFGGYDGNGFLYGVGMDYLVSPQFFVGADYIVRDVSSDWPGGTFDADVDTFSVRAGMNF